MYEHFQDGKKSFENILREFQIAWKRLTDSIMGNAFSRISSFTRNMDWKSVGSITGPKSLHKTVCRVLHISILLNTKLLPVASRTENTHLTSLTSIIFAYKKKPLAAPFLSDWMQCKHVRLLFIFIIIVIMSIDKLNIRILKIQSIYKMILPRNESIQWREKNEMALNINNDKHIRVKLFDRIDCCNSE